MNIEERRKYDRERKQQQRLENTPYAMRVRQANRSDKSKEKRQKLRSNPEQKEKEKLYAREYRKRPEARKKAKAREAVKHALAIGIITRPDKCEICGFPDLKLKDGRSGLRADHCAGYDEENKLNVKFICINCDGKQLRKF